MEKHETFQFRVKIASDLETMSLVFLQSSPQRIAISTIQQNQTILGIVEYIVSFTDLGLDLSNEFAASIIDISVEGANSDCVSSSYTTTLYSGCKPDRALVIDFESQSLCPEKTTPCLFFREGLYPHT
jgi:hypothetical protein